MDTSPENTDKAVGGKVWDPYSKKAQNSSSSNTGVSGQRLLPIGFLHMLVVGIMLCITVLTNNH